MGRNHMIRNGLQVNTRGEKLCKKLWKTGSKRGSWFLTWRNPRSYIIVEVKRGQPITSI